MEICDEFEDSFREAFGHGLSGDLIDGILTELRSSNGDFDSLVQRAVDVALNHVLLEHTSAAPQTSVRAEAVHDCCCSYAAAAARPAPNSDTGWRTMSTRKIKRKNDPARTGTASGAQEHTKPVSISAFDSLRSLLPPNLPDGQLHASLRTHDYNVTAALNSIMDSLPTSEVISKETKYSAPNHDRRFSTLSLLTDEGQLSAFHELRALLPAELEDWYLLDTLMTYNFNVGDTVCVVFEEMGRAKMTYGNVVKRGVHGHSIKPVGASSNIASIVRQSIKVEPISTREYIVSPPTDSSTSSIKQIVLALDPFQWRRPESSSQIAVETLCQLNPLLDLSIDRDNGQIKFCGLKNKASSKSVRSEKVTIDFHHSTVKVALEVTRSAIVYYVQMRHDKTQSATASTHSGRKQSHNHPRNYVLQLLFGLGTHSYAGRCVLQVAVCNYLDRREVPHERSADGAFTTIKL